jgi:hypothetical protein
VPAPSVSGTACAMLSNRPGFKPFRGKNLKLGPNTDASITGNRSYSRAHFLHYAGAVKPGIYR